MPLNGARHLTLLPPVKADRPDQRDVLADLIYLSDHEKHSIAALFGKCETFQASNRCQPYFDFVREHQDVFEPYFRASEKHQDTAKLREAVNYLQMITYLSITTSRLDPIRRRNYGYLFSGFEAIIKDVVAKINGQKIKKDEALPMELVAIIRNSALAAGK